MIDMELLAAHADELKELKAQLRRLTDALMVQGIPVPVRDMVRCPRCARLVEPLEDGRYPGHEINYPGARGQKWPFCRNSGQPIEQLDASVDAEQLLKAVA